MNVHTVVFPMSHTTHTADTPQHETQHTTTQHQQHDHNTTRRQRQTERRQRKKILNLSHPSFFFIIGDPCTHHDTLFSHRFPMIFRRAMVTHAWRARCPAHAGSIFDECVIVTVISCLGSNNDEECSEVAGLYSTSSAPPRPCGLCWSQMITTWRRTALRIVRVQSHSSLCVHCSVFHFHGARRQGTTP